MFKIGGEVLELPQLPTWMMKRMIVVMIKTKGLMLSAKSSKTAMLLMKHCETLIGRRVRQKERKPRIKWKNIF